MELEKERREIRDFFFKNRIPVFPTEARAFKAIANMAKYNYLYLPSQSLLETNANSEGL
jgi:beta-N-acetylglucosaminidase